MHMHKNKSENNIDFSKHRLTHTHQIKNQLLLSHNNHMSATSTVVTVAEILKNNGLAETKRIQTSVVDVTLDNGRTVQKAKVEIALDKSANFDEIVNFKDDDAGAEKAATS